MNKFLKYLAVGLCSFLVVVTTACGSLNQPQTTVQYEARPIEVTQNQTASEFVASMGAVGIDADWAMTPKRGMDAYQSSFPKKFREIGVTHARIRTKNNAPDAQYLKHLGRVVDDTLASGLVPVVAYQADEYKDKPNQANLKKDVGVVRQLAYLLKDKGNEVAIDLMIEPTDALNKNPDALNLYLREAKAAVREISPNRIVFITSIVRSDPANLKLVDPTLYLNDQFVAVQFHGYASGPSKDAIKKERKLWTTGTEQEKQIFRDYIQPALDFRKETGVPIWFGAIMMGNYNEENYYSLQEQIEFARFVNSTLRQANVGYALNSDRMFLNAQGEYTELVPVLQAITK